VNQLGRPVAAAVGTDTVAPMVVHIGYPRTASSFLQTQVFRPLPNNVPARHYDTLPETGAALHEAGIGSQVHYIPVHPQPYYRKRYATPRLPGTERFYERVISLLLSASMQNVDVDRVVDALGGALTCSGNKALEPRGEAMQ
jgi:hypothetical protein